jgi:hypothetical protein
MTAATSVEDRSGTGAIPASNRGQFVGGLPSAIAVRIWASVRSS